MWVSSSERPLRISELCQAFGVKIGSADLDLGNIPTISTLLGCFFGLITVEESFGTLDLSTSLCKSIHLGLPQILQSMVVEVCLTYLSFHRVQRLLPALSSFLPTVPLIEYASYHRGKHVRRDMIESASPLFCLQWGAEQVFWVVV